MNLADERVREHLAWNGPIGTWRSVPGSHLALCDETLRFADDGSGEMRLGAPLDLERRVVFRWRAEAFGVVACQPTDPPPELGDDGEPEAADWFRIAFEFVRHATDTGTYWVLRERGRQGFWDLTAPLIPASASQP